MNNGIKATLGATVTSVILTACGNPPEWKNGKIGKAPSQIIDNSDDSESNPTKPGSSPEPVPPMNNQPDVKDPGTGTPVPPIPSPQPEPIAPITMLDTDCTKHKGLVHQMFSDDMVLQRSMMNPIWGCTKPSEKVKVNLAGKVVETTSDKAGFWKVRLPALEAGGPHQVTIESSTSLTLKNVLVGDVFLCSGQSNMEWEGLRATGIAEDLASADKFPQVRLYQATKTAPYAKAPASLFPGTPRWTVPDQSKAERFSAVCYLFGRALHEKYKIPIGLISSSSGGTRAEAWTSAEFLKNIPESAENLAQLKSGMADLSNKNTATVLYNSLIQPIFPFGMKAALWYQGESNEGNAAVYKRLLPIMIADWRKQSGIKDLPFLVVQLAGYRARSTSAVQLSGVPEIREAQFLTSLNVPNVGLATAVDLSQADGDIHPTNKKDVALRLAVAAQNLLYKAKVSSSPIFKAAIASGNEMIVSFDESAVGLTAARKVGLAAPVPLTSGPIEGFGLAGSDGIFHNAVAKVDEDGKTVRVSSSKVAKPIAVRYGWSENPQCNLYNKSGFPVIPFRSDLKSSR